MEILKLENVFKSYKNFNDVVWALNDISLTINRGEFVVILGPSGSGKSTLLNLLSGIDKKTKGKIYFDGERIDNYNDKQLLDYRKNNVGFIFQTYNLIANLTVYENIELGLELAKEKLDVNEIMETIGISSLKDKYPYQLSGGQMQRVAIARALLKNPLLLFCDEPTGALDEQNGKKILKVLSDVNKKYKTTVIVVTHNPSIAKMANKIIKMNSGKIEYIKENEHCLDVESIGWS